MSRIAIVGSRRRLDRDTIETTVLNLPADTVVVSGGCRGVDSWAVAAARKRGLQIVEHLPDLAGIRSRGEAASRYYARNQLIVDDADLVIAFPATDRTGGTEDTIRRAMRAGKPVDLR